MRRHYEWHEKNRKENTIEKLELSELNLISVPNAVKRETESIFETYVMKRKKFEIRNIEKDVKRKEFAQTAVQN